MENNRRVLERVQADLAQGYTFVALQRLSTLIQEQPHDLAVRGWLAHVHQRTGNWVEAGRWCYLTGTLDPKSVLAFERAYPHPRARLDALRWTASREDTPAAVNAVLDPLRAALGPAPQGPRGARLVAQVEGPEARSMKENLLIGGLVLALVAALVAIAVILSMSVG